MTETKIDTRPIKGDIRKRDRPTVEQKGPQEFIQEIDALLALPGVEKIAWTQYTPYFNDGDPCEFNTYSVAISFVDGFLPGTPDEDETEGIYDVEGTWFVTYDMHTYPEVNGQVDYKGEKIYDEFGYDLKAHHDALQKFEKSLNAYYNVLQDNFGDHALVIADVFGFSVEHYDHD